MNAALFLRQRSGARLALAAVTMLLTVAVPSAVPAQQPIASVIEAAAVLPMLDRADVVILDLRRRAEYRAGHLRGAVNLDPVAESFRRTTGSGLPRLVGPVEFAEQMSRLGIGSDHRLVLLTKGESWLDLATATDLFWILKRYGHEHVAIANGGMRRIARIPGIQLVKQTSERPATDYRVAAPRVVPATLEALRAAPLVVDGRLRGQFLGINRTVAVPRYGTVEGARNLPGNWVTLDAGAVFRTPDQLRPILRLTGVPEEGPVVVFGNTALAGSMVWFALRVVMGNREARLFEPGFGAWLEDSANPVEVHLQKEAVQQP